MFDYTYAVILKTVKEIRFFTLALKVLVFMSTIAYLIYSCFAGIGNVYANIVLCAATSAYFIFYVLKVKKIIKKREFSASKHLYRIIKLTTNALVLLIAIYGIIIGTASNASAIKTYLLLAIWVVQLLIEIIALAIETRLDMFRTAIKYDASALIKVFKKNADLPTKDNSYIEKLEPIVEEAHKRKLAKRAAKKQARSEAAKEKAKQLLHIK